MTDPTEMTTVLEVIDATLAGDAVGPENAELAELSLLLAGEREPASREFSARLDARVARRFAPAPADAAAAAERPRRRRWLLAPGLATGLAALVAVLVVVGVHVHSSSSSSSSSSFSGVAASGVARDLRRPAGAAGTERFGSAQGSLAPTPPSTGRQIVQSAQVALSTPPNRVDSVAQQVFDVVAAQNGVVENSNVTATAAYGTAQFSLSVPSAHLAGTLNALSALRGANVASRSDATQDVTGRLGGAGQRLAEARALRTALLRQLAAAATATAVSSLRTQIHDVDASIASDLATLRSLQRKVAYSQIQVSINSVASGHPVPSGGGFTLARALHDAGRVLVVAAGVALIALAVLVPLGLIVALGLWLAFALRRRRREQALDLI